MHPEFEAVIGLEVHCQLSTESKIFCGCRARLEGGKSVAELRPKVGVGRKELLRILGKIKWTKAESAELKKAMDVSDVVGYAGRD